MAKRIIYVNDNGTLQQLVANDPIATVVLGNATTVTETVVAHWRLPANFLTIGMGICLKAGFLSGGTGTLIFRLRIGTAGTIADALACQLVTSAAQIANARGEANFTVYATSITSLTAIGFGVMQNAILGQIKGGVTNITVVPTAQIFLSITAQSSIAAANITPLASAVIQSW